MTHNFVAAILTHGRPDAVYTYHSLRRSGYTGDIILLCDNEDTALPLYQEQYGDQVHVFDKAAEAEHTDACDNFQHRNAIVYARNYVFRLVKQLGYEYFMQLDDDYNSWTYRKGYANKYQGGLVKNLDVLFDALIHLVAQSGADSIALAQGGDFIGGRQNTTCFPHWRFRRKAMNTWICHVDRPLRFCGHMNEDCSQYTVEGRRGKLFFQVPFASIKQPLTQAQSGGMSELYEDSGTYLKTFYTVMQAPSCAKVGMIYSKHARIHHNIFFKHCASKILHERWKKSLSLEPGLPEQPQQPS